MKQQKKAKGMIISIDTFKEAITDYPAEIAKLIL